MKRIFIHRDSGAAGAGGAAQLTADEQRKADAIKEVERIAAEKATAIFMANKDKFITEEIKSEASKTLIKELATEALESMSFKNIAVEEDNGKITGLNTLIKEMQKQHDELAIKVRGMGGIINQQVGTIMGQLKAQFEARSADLKAIHSSKSGVVQFELKAVSPITTASFGDRVIIGLREQGVDYPRLPERFIFDLISTMTGGPGSNPLSWVELVNGSGAPGWQTDEGAEKASMNWTYVENKVTAEMIAVWTPVSRQALLNWPMLEQEIRFELTRRLFNKLDQAVLNGTGTNEIYGITYYATDFAAGSLAGTVVDANRGDVLRAAIGQVRKGAENASPEIGGFNPNFILVSEDTYTSMDLEKSALNGMYLYPRFMDEASTRIKGIPIIASNFIEDDQFIVGDFTKYLFNFVENLRIDVGYINDQFVKNLLTVRAELYGMGRVKNHERPAFVTGDFPTAIAELNATT